MRSAARIVEAELRLANARLLEACAGEAGPLLRSHGAHSPSIAFHLWHVARWSDRLAASLPGFDPRLGRRLGPGRQVWVTDGLATRWGFPSRAGFADSGMGLAAGIAVELPFPDPAELRDYLARSIAACEAAVAAVDDDLFRAPLVIPYDEEETIGEVIVGHLVHVARHLGMTEALRGLGETAGSATV